MSIETKIPTVKVTAETLQPGDSWKTRRNRDSYIDKSMIELFVVSVEDDDERYPENVIVTTRRGSDGYIQGYRYRRSHPFTVRREAQQ